MKNWIIVSLSEEYYLSTREPVTGEHGREFAKEEHEFWWLAEDLAQIASQVYVLRPFHGAEQGGGPEIPTLLISFASGSLAPVAIAFIQYLTKYLTRNASRELTIERGDAKVTLKGRSLSEEKQLLRMLFPELTDDPETES